jgi:hypothetical protein
MARIVCLGPHKSEGAPCYFLRNCLSCDLNSFAVKPGRNVKCCHGNADICYVLYWYLRISLSKIKNYLRFYVHSLTFFGMNNWISLTDFYKSPYINCHVNPHSEIRIVPRGETGGQTDMKKVISTFRDFADTSQKVLTDTRVKKAKKPNAPVSPPITYYFLSGSNTTLCCIL